MPQLRNAGGIGEVDTKAVSHVTWLHKIGSIFLSLLFSIYTSIISVLLNRVVDETAKLNLNQ